MRLRAVLEQVQPFDAAELAPSVHVVDLTVEMDKEHCPGARRDRTLDARDVEQRGVGIDVGQNGGRPRMDDREDRGNGSHRRGDDFIASTGSHRAQSDFNRFHAVADADTERGAAEPRPASRTPALPSRG